MEASVTDEPLMLPEKSVALSPQERELLRELLARKQIETKKESADEMTALEVD
jgi:hypothetical protein